MLLYYQMYGTVLIGLFVLINSLPFFVGLIRTPANYFFLGTIHHPIDYLTYLSQFAQGKTNWIRVYDLYSGDFKTPTLVGWVNVLLGKLFSLVSINHFFAYQIAVMAFAALFLFLSYRLIQSIFPKDHTASRIALTLFLISNSFPGSTDSMWFNYFNPVTRLGGVPHQILTSVLLVAVFLLAGKRNILRNIGLALCGFVVASLQPIQWALLVAVLFLTGAFIPGLIIALSGFPMTMYLKLLFQNPPFSQMASWEALQQVRVTPMSFFGASGPIFLLGLLGLPLFLRRTHALGRMIVLYALVSYALFFSPLPSKFSLQNIRFLSPLVVVFFSCFAASFIVTVSKQLKNWKFISWSIVAFLAALLMPLQIRQMWERFDLPVHNAYLYLPKEAVNAMVASQTFSSYEDTFLVVWPFNVSFPAVSVRRSFNGHPLATIEAARKDQENYDFFSGAMTPEARKKFLIREDIAFVISYPGSFLSQTDFLSREYGNSLLVVYKVNKHLLE